MATGAFRILPPAGLAFGWLLGRYVLGAVLALVLAWAAWKAAGPAPRAAVPYITVPAKAALAEPVAAQHLFGEPPAAPAPTVAPLPEILVKAVFAELGAAPSYAILLVDKQPQVVRVSSEIRPGIVLVRVSGHEIELRRGSEVVRLPVEPGKPPAVIPVLK